MFRTLLGDEYKSFLICNFLYSFITSCVLGPTSQDLVFKQPHQHH